jgi:hypothetical protein
MLGGSDFALIPTMAPCNGTQCPTTANLLASGSSVLGLDQPKFVSSSSGVQEQVVAGDCDGTVVSVSNLPKARASPGLVPVVVPTACFHWEVYFNPALISDSMGGFADLPSLAQGIHRIR